MIATQVRLVAALADLKFDVNDSYPWQISHFKTVVGIADSARKSYFIKDSIAYPKFDLVSGRHSS